MQKASLFNLLENWIFPPKCVVTDELTQKFDLQDELIQEWKLSKTLCPSCLEKETLGKVCAGCLQLDNPIIFRVLFRYNSELSSLIQNLKYNDHLYLSRLFAELWFTEFGTLQTDKPQVDALIPIPLHLKRYKERGFNQAEEWAKFLAKFTGIPLVNALDRIKTTPTQTGLKPIERHKNLQNAFALNAKEAEKLAHAKRVAILDDVITTGATTQSAIRELRKHHPLLCTLRDLEIEVWGIAKTQKGVSR